MITMTMTMEFSDYQLSTLNPKPSSLQLLLEDAGDVGFAFVQNNAEVGLGFGKQIGGPFDDVAVGFFRFDDEEHDVHKLRQPGSGADLTDRRHVENDVVVVAGLELWHQVLEALGKHPRQVVAVAGFGNDIQIVLDEGGVALAEFQSVIQTAVEIALIKMMGCALVEIHIDKQDVAVTRFG